MVKLVETEGFREKVERNERKIGEVLREVLMLSTNTILRVLSLPCA